MSRAFKAGVTPVGVARKAVKAAHAPKQSRGRLKGWEMNAAQRRIDLDRLATHRRKVGGDMGPEVGWIEVMANYIRIKDGHVTSERVHTEAKRLWLPPLDRELVEDRVAEIAARAFQYRLYTPRVAGAKLHLTKAEREAADIHKMDAIDETRAERRRRVDRERKQSQRAAKAAPARLTKKAMAEALEISRPTLDKWIKEGKVDPDTGEITDFTPASAGPYPFRGNPRTKNVNPEARV